MLNQSAVLQQSRAVIGKIAALGLTLSGLLLLTFLIGRVLPVDPASAIVGEQADRDTYLRVAHELGLDQPIYVRVYSFSRKMLVGDFGYSANTGHRVSDDLRRVLPATIELAFVGGITGIAAGLLLGVLGAVYHERALDHLGRGIALVGSSMPSYWVGLIGLRVFYSHLGWVGGPERISITNIDAAPTMTGSILVDALLAHNHDLFIDAVRHIVLPAAILALGVSAHLSRMTRAFMLEQLQSPHVLAARAKGLSNRKVLWNHAFRNTRMQLITIIALTVAQLLEGSVLLESVFAWPGLGQYFTQALLIGDMNAIVACTLLTGTIFIIVNSTVEHLHSQLDPRTASPN